MVKVAKTYDVEVKGTGRPDHLGKNISFATDPQDIWGNIVTLGNAELAARLGSINMFERRGATVWMDDFENGVDKWLPTTVGTGASVTWSAARYLSGGASCLLTAGSDMFCRAAMSARISFPILSNIGLEFAFLMPNTPVNIIINSIIYDGTNYYNGAIYIDIFNDRLDYGNILTAIGTFNSSTTISARDYLWHKCKFVVDYTTNKFIRFMLDNATYDLSAYNLTKEDSDIKPSLSFDIYNNGTFGANDKLYIDNVIVTQDEPVE